MKVKPTRQQTESLGETLQKHKYKPTNDTTVQQFTFFSYSRNHELEFV